MAVQLLGPKTCVKIPVVGIDHEVSLATRGHQARRRESRNLLWKSFSAVRRFGDKDNVGEVRVRGEALAVTHINSLRSVGGDPLSVTGGNERRGRIDFAIVAV